MDETKRDGGPVFPLVAADGMSLRDWFAGQALAGLTVGRQERVEQFAAEAYAIADAMLAARDEV